MSTVVLPPPRQVETGLSASVAIARPVSGKGHGTAWLCGNNLALTACHVVPPDRRLKLTFGNGTRADATMVDWNVEFDVALLQLEQIEPSDGLGPVLAIDTDGFVQEGQPWHGWGHPIGYPSGYPINGAIGGMGYDRGVQEMHLRCEQKPAQALQGISGGPVLDGNGAAIGMFREALTLIDGSLVATRLDDAWAALPGWRNAAPETRSAGPISRYLDGCLSNWERTTYATPYRKRQPPRIDDVFVEPRFRAANAQQSRTATATMGVDALLAQLRSHDQHIVLRGDPGSGKSSLLRWLCLRLAHAWHLGERRSEVPVLVHASTLAGGKSIDDVIAEVDPIFASPPPPGVHWLVLIDGLDEIIDLEERRVVLASIKRRFALARSRVRPALRLLLATRPLALLDEMSMHEATHLVLKPFDRVQIEAFARNWFRTSDPSLADDFLAQLRIARLEGLVTTPALATVTAVVFERSPGRQLPRRKADLYDRYIELALGARNDDVLARFCNEFERTYPGEGTALAQHLWQQRDALIEALAMGVQLGKLPPEGGDFAQAALDWAVDRQLLVLHPHRPFENEQLHALFSDLVLSSGLLVAPAENVMAFQQNPLREALVARAQSRDLAHGTSAEIQRFARLWVHVRWREIVSLVLARWSEEGAGVREAIWDVLQPIMASGNRGVHFSATALAEGLQLGSEAEQIVYDALIKRTDDWNPCAELFNEFESPNPADALRALADRDDFVRTLVKRLRADQTECCKKAALLVQLAIDVASIDSVAPLLEAIPCVARVASLLIGRAGRVDLVLPQLLAMAAGQEGDRLGVARIMGEEANAADLHDFLENPFVDAAVRVYALLHAPETYRAQATARLARIDLDWTNAEHVSVARRALAIGVTPAFERLKDGTCLTYLYAVGEEGPRLPNAVRRAARRMLAQEPTTSERGLRIAAILLSQQPSEEDIQLSRERFDAFTEKTDALLDLASALARFGVDEPLRELAANHQSLDLARHAAVRLSNVGLQQSARDMLMSMASQDIFAVDALFEIGETELALRYCLAGASHDTNFVRRLRTWGYGKELTGIAKNPQAASSCRRLAIASLEYFGNFEALLDVANEPEMPAPLALDAARRARNLGWVPEAMAAGEAIAARENLPTATLEEMEAASIRRQILEPSETAETLLKVASDGGLGYSEHVYETLMDREDLSTEQALLIYEKCRSKNAFAKLKTKALGRAASARELANFIRISLDHGTVDAALQAVSELTGPRPPGEEDFPRWWLVESLEHVAQILRIAIVRDPTEPPYRRFTQAARLPDTSKQVREAAYVAMATSPSVAVPDRLEAAVHWMDSPTPEGEQTVLRLLREVLDGGCLADAEESAVDAVLLFDPTNFPDVVLEIAQCLMEWPTIRPSWRRAVATWVAHCGHLRLAQPHLEAITVDTNADKKTQILAALTLAEHNCPKGLLFLAERYAGMANERESEDVWFSLRKLVFADYVAEAIRLSLLLSSDLR